MAGLKTGGHRAMNASDYGPSSGDKGRDLRGEVINHWVLVGMGCS
jgi:hypothetical protein